MIEAAAANGVKLMIAYRLHLEQGNLEAAQLAQSGELEDPRFFSSDFAQQAVENNIRVTEPVEKGGGPVYDMGVYCINAARYLFRAEPASVLACSGSNREPRFQKVDEMTSVVMRFPDERLATFTCSFGAADISRYTLVGTKGVLTADSAYKYASGIKHQSSRAESRAARGFPKAISLPPR